MTVTEIRKIARNLGIKTGKLRILADFIRIHRQEHALNLLRSVAERVLACGLIEPVLQSFIRVDQGVT